MKNKIVTKFNLKLILFFNQKMKVKSTGIKQEPKTKEIYMFHAALTTLIDKHILNTFGLPTNPSARIQGNFLSV